MLSPMNMEPDRGVLEDHFPKGTPLSGSMLIGRRVYIYIYSIHVIFGTAVGTRLITGPSVSGKCGSTRKANLDGG